MQRTLLPFNVLNAKSGKRKETFDAFAGADTLAGQRLREVLADASASYPYTKSFYVSTVTHGYVLRGAEGHNITAILPDGSSMQKEYVSEHNFGATSVSYNLQEEAIPPVGTYIVTVSYYGGYIVNVRLVVPESELTC